MEEEILVGGAVVFKERGGKTSWLIVKPGGEENWQLVKAVVRREESSVRTVIRTLVTLGLYVSVIEEIGRINTTTTRDGNELPRRVIYYLIQQRGSTNEKTYSAKVAWAQYSTARLRLGTITEKRIFAQAREVLSEWQKEERPRPLP